MNKILKIAVIAVILAVMSVPSFAYDIGKAGEYIPDELKNYLPQEALDGSNAGGNGYTALDLKYFTSLICDMLLSLLTPALSKLAVLLGAVIIAAAIGAMKNSVPSEALNGVYDFVSTMCVALTAYALIDGLCDRISETLGKLCLLMNSMLPVMSTLYAAGGNAATATVNNAGMAAALAVMENVCYYGLYPVLRICFGLSLVAGLTGVANISGVSGFVRNTFTTLLVFVMTVMTAVLAFQTNLSAGADCLTVRTVKFAAANIIPVIGGSVGEAVRTIGSSLSYIKNTVGTLAIIGILLLVLPVFISILLYKFCLNLSGVVAKVLGCEREGALLNDLYGMLNYSLAVLSACSVFFIFSLTLFIKSSAALGS